MDGREVDPDAHSDTRMRNRPYQACGLLHSQTSHLWCILWRYLCCTGWPQIMERSVCIKDLRGGVIVSVLTSGALYVSQKRYATREVGVAEQHHSQ